LRWLYPDATHRGPDPVRQLLADLQDVGYKSLGQSSLRVTAGYERERAERLNEARERLDRKETVKEVATDVATGIAKALLSFLRHR
jgi:hypothetical protein